MNVIFLQWLNDICMFFLNLKFVSLVFYSISSQNNTLIDAAYLILLSVIKTKKNLIFYLIFSEITYTFTWKSMYPSNSILFEYHIFT